MSQLEIFWHEFDHWVRLRDLAVPLSNSLMSSARAFDSALESMWPTNGVCKLSLHLRKFLTPVEPPTGVET